MITNSRKYFNALWDNSMMRLDIEHTVGLLMVPKDGGSRSDFLVNCRSHRPASWFWLRAAKRACTPAHSWNYKVAARALNVTMPDDILGVRVGICPLTDKPQKDVDLFLLSLNPPYPWKPSPLRPSYKLGENNRLRTSARRLLGTQEMKGDVNSPKKATDCRVSLKRWCSDHSPAQNSASLWNWAEFCSQGAKSAAHTADRWPSAILSLLENFLLPLWKTGVRVFMH